MTIYKYPIQIELWFPEECFKLVNLSSELSIELMSFQSNSISSQYGNNIYEYVDENMSTGPVYFSNVQPTFK